MALVGILARVDAERRVDVTRDLEQLPGVTTFAVGDEQRIGILVERGTLDEAHASTRQEIEPIPGVLGVWPVFCYADEEVQSAELAAQINQARETDVDGQHAS